VTSRIIAGAAAPVTGAPLPTVPLREIAPWALPFGLLALLVDTVVSRHDQHTWGLLTGYVASREHTQVIASMAVDTVGTPGGPGGRRTTTTAAPRRAAARSLGQV